MDYSPPGSSIHGILQKRKLELVALPSSRGSSQSRDPTQVSCIPGKFLRAPEPPGTPQNTHIMDYYSAFKMKEILTEALSGMKFEDIVLSEKNPTQKDKYCIILLI